MNYAICRNFLNATGAGLKVTADALYLFSYCEESRLPEPAGIRQLENGVAVSWASTGGGAVEVRMENNGISLIISEGLPASASRAMQVKQEDILHAAARLKRYIGTDSNARPVKKVRKHPASA